MAKAKEIPALRDDQEYMTKEQFGQRNGGFSLSTVDGWIAQGVIKVTVFSVGGDGRNRTVRISRSEEARFRRALEDRSEKLAA